jgi:hypothetical protein
MKAIMPSHSVSNFVNCCGLAILAIVSCVQFYYDWLETFPSSLPLLLEKLVLISLWEKFGR